MSSEVFFPAQSMKRLIIPSPLFELLSQVSLPLQHNNTLHHVRYSSLTGTGHEALSNSRCAPGIL